MFSNSKRRGQLPINVAIGIVFILIILAVVFYKQIPENSGSDKRISSPTERNIVPSLFRWFW